MKKFLAAVMGLLMIFSLPACSSNLPKGYSPLKQTPQETPSTPVIPVQPPLPEGADLFTGLAVLNSLENSMDAGEEDGLAEINSSVAAVLVDSDGRIVSCKIDAVQSKLNFSKDGRLTSDYSAPVSTKQELKEAYGMKKASGIGKEWYEQADALAAYVTGKTMEEVRGIALTETTAPADLELSASVTIKLGEWIDVIEKAVANARPLGARAGDTLGLGITTKLSGSLDAGEADGLAQTDSMYGAATFGPDGRITSCILDGSQCGVNFDRNGKIITDLTESPLTKNELKEAYGMKKASGIGLEWYEQAANYAAYALGKTANELSGLAVSDRGAPADAELSASVTISIGDFNLCLTKASVNAA